MTESDHGVHADVLSRDGSHATRMPRTMWIIGVAAVAGILAVSLGLAFGLRSDPVEAAASASPTPSLAEVVSPSPMPSASVSPSASPTREPVPAVSRGEGHPDAYVMEDWVWEDVGPGWSVASTSDRSDPYDEDQPPLPEAVLYLVSPDDEYFELVEFEPALSDGLRVVSWHEDSRMARVIWYGYDDVAGSAALVDLTTGMIDPLEFTWQGETTKYVSFLAANSDGDELWEARFDDIGGRFYRWSDSGGWTVAAVSDLDGMGEYHDDGDRGWGAESYGPGGPISPFADGNAVVFEERAWGPYPEQRDFFTVGVYRLDTEAIVTQSVHMGDCGLYSWDSLDTLTYACWSEPDDPYRDVTIPGLGEPLGEVPPSTTQVSQPAYVSSRVGFGQAPEPGVGYFDCSC